MQWDLEVIGRIGVLRLSGFLSERVTRRFDGAVEWALARCPGAVVVDLSALTGWNRAGEAAVVAAASRLNRGRPVLVVCGLRERPAPVLLSEATSAVLLVQPDVETALALLEPR